jgi:predicted nucleic acid-binding protein
MAAKVFVDTNILLRATISQFPLHTESKSLINSQLNAGTELWISRQVIREYINQATRPQIFMNPMTFEQVDAQYHAMRIFFNIADETETVTTQLMALLKEYPTGGKQVHDANIVATMLVNAIDTLLTLNVSDFKRFEGKIKLITLEETK